MNGLTVFETEAVHELLAELRSLRLRAEEMHAELKSLKEPYMTTSEVAALTRFGEKWVQDNKEKLGFKNVGGNLRFKRKDVEAFMNEDYFIAKRS